MPPDLLRLAAVVAFILTGILLLVDAITIKQGLAVDSFALAALSAIVATAPTWRR
jgi:hypothetical protein